MAGSKLKDLGQMMLGKGSGGPPIPKKEIIKLLKRVRVSLDQLIARLEKADKPAAKPAKRKRPK